MFWIMVSLLGAICTPLCRNHGTTNN
jgi:hypothetical protein